MGHALDINIWYILLVLILGAIGVLTAFLLVTLLYAWVSKKVLIYAKKEPFPIKEMRKKYFIITIVFAIIIYITFTISTEFISTLPPPVDVTKEAIVYLLLHGVIFTWLINLLLRDANDKHIGWKYSSIISIINLFITILLTLLVMLMMNIFMN